MKRIWLGVAAATMVSACSGGNPWLEGDVGDPVEGIPAELLGDLDNYSYDPVAQTLIVRGTSLDDTPYQAAYTRKPALDVPGYEAYTIQEGSLQRHVTAYVQARDGVSAAIVVTGGQFGSFFGGSSFTRSGTFDPPPTSTNGGLVSYAGTYVGLLNVPGDGGDLLPVTPGTPPDVLPVQAAEVTGNVLINADFSDNVVNGLVYNRVIVDFPATDLSNQDIELAPTTIQSDGTFIGQAEQDNGRSDVGAYAGVFGGRDSSAVAGTLVAGEHIDGLTGIHEHGLFVLAQCGTPNADPICNQPNP